MKRTALILGLISAALAQQPAKTRGQPQQSPVSRSQPSFRPPTATEVFHLTEKCAKLAKKFNEEHDEAWVQLSKTTGEIPRLEQEYDFHYSPRTNRCYVKITVQPAYPVALLTDRYMNQKVFDGQTGKELVGVFRRKGTTSALLDFDGRVFDPQAPEEKEA
jgi:hypothetical protein